MKFFQYFALIILLAIADGTKDYKLENYVLCASKPFKKFVEFFTDAPTLKLEGGLNSAVTIEQQWNETNFKMVKENCTFTVVSHEPVFGGLYVFIKKLKLRRDDTGKCVDYIRFSRDRKTPGHTFCGELENAQVFKQDQKMTVNVYINRNRSKYPLFDLELSILITSYAVCNPDDDFVCEPENNICISKYLVKDGYPNCSPPCRDENTCLPHTKDAVVISKSNIAITAITSLIFTMVGVIACVWICYKYRRCFRRRSRANSSIRRSSADIPTIEMPSSPAAGAGSNTAPPIKDLPPSYESLFPAG